MLEPTTVSLQTTRLRTFFNRYLVVCVECVCKKVRALFPLGSWFRFHVIATGSHGARVGKPYCANGKRKEQ